MAHHAFSPEQLASYTGDSGRPVYVAIKGVIYDVTSGASFYGPGGSYSVFAGKECSRALALMLINQTHCNDNLSDLNERQLKTLDDWIRKFQDKYPVIGRLST